MTFDETFDTVTTFIEKTFSGRDVCKTRKTFFAANKTNFLRKAKKRAAFFAQKKFICGKIVIFAAKNKMFNP